MARTLIAGVLPKLLEEMEEDTSSVTGDAISMNTRRSRHHQPSLLRVTSIIPAIAGIDLFPNHGFYLEVSDSSQSIYASLPPNQTDLILNDRLQVGQLIHIRCLQPSHPYPILCGLRLLPGHHRRTSTPVFSTVQTSPSFHTVSRKSPRSIPTSPIKGATKRQEMERRRQDVLGEMTKIRVTCMDESEEEEIRPRLCRTLSSSSSSNYSSSSSSSSVLTPKPKLMRKGWDSPSDAKERSRQVKPPLFRSWSTNVSRTELTHYGSNFMHKNDTSFDDLLAGIKDTDLKVSSPSKQKPGASNQTCIDNSCVVLPFSSFDETTRWSETRVKWESLPSSIMQHGKQVMRQRDLALDDVVNALLEASVSERLLQCLSTYSEIQSDKEANPQNLIDKFLDFHSELREARKLAHSLANLGPLSAGAAEKPALEKKKCAASWIKAAFESNLSQFPSHTNSAINLIEFSPSDGSFLNPINKQRNTLVVATNLASALSSECNAWFLRYIDKYLDVVRSEISYSGSETQIASLLCQLKRVDEWLESVGRRERDWSSGYGWKGSGLLEDEQIEACGRVWKKIYDVLLMHVDSAAIALKKNGIN